MLTIRAAARLLQHAGDISGLVAVAEACGVEGKPIPLDAFANSALGLPDSLADIHVASGDGHVRALIAVLHGPAGIREQASRVARALSRRAPHLLWLALLSDRVRGEMAIIAWDASRRAPRVVALHTECARIVDSDAETLCALAAVRDEETLARHGRWLEILGREALSRRFYGLLERVVTGLATSAPGGVPESVRRELALLDLSRLLFLAFLQAKGWLDGDRDFLARLFHDAMRGGDGSRYHARILRPLFFGTLNTPPARRAAAARRFGRIPFLNGGLFARTPLEKRWNGVHFSDEAFGLIHGELLAHYRFTAREDSSSWSEAAVDPEMLGRAFESLMADRMRKDSGAFYTPQAVVERLVSDALLAALECAASPAELRALIEGRSVASHATLLQAVCNLKVLDPACGSGAFLVHVLERLATMRALLGEEGSIATLRRAVLVRNVFGVDLNPTAVWLCELRLWLSVVIESDVAHPCHVPPLPNLDRNVRVGDALAGEALVQGPDGEGRSVRRLRERYVRATGARKRTVLAALEREERRLAIRALEREQFRLAGERAELLAILRQRDLWGQRKAVTARERETLSDVRARLRASRDARAALRDGAALPFAFASHFGDVAADGGFGLVIGNPPWVRLHRIPVRLRESLKRRFVVYREAAWRAGADLSHAGTGFGGQVDLAALFVERSLQLARPSGAVALLVPAKLFRTLAAGGVRRLLAGEASVRALHDFTDGASLFDAAVYPAAIVAGRTHEPAAALITVHRRRGARTWCAEPGALAFDRSPGSPLLLVPPDVRTAFDAVRSAGLPMASSVIGRPLLGVKCGRNDAFLVPAAVDSPLPLRPVLRGESLGMWRAATPTEALVWTHDDDGRPLRDLCGATRAHFAPWRRVLEARSDLHSGDAWWSLFRVEGAASRRHRVVWADVARSPRAVYLPSGDVSVPLNSCYVAACDDETDALALCALLNSPLAAAWLALIAEPARGGYRRFLGWTMALFPIPRSWNVVRHELAALTAQALRGDIPTASALLQTTTRAYQLDAGDVAPLLAWAHDEF